MGQHVFKKITRLFNGQLIASGCCNHAHILVFQYLLSTSGMANLFKWWVKFKVINRKKKNRGLRLTMSNFFRPKSGEEQKKGHHFRRVQFSAQNREKSKKRSSRPRAVKFFKLQEEVGH